jgi:hypothetical protein
LGENSPNLVTLIIFFRRNLFSGQSCCAADGRCYLLIFALKLKKGIVGDLVKTPK